MLQTIPIPDTEERETPPIPSTDMVRFLLTFDYSKSKVGGINRFQQHHAEGVCFSKGMIALAYDNGNTDGYGSLNEMVQALSRMGKHHIEWVDRWQ